MSFIVSLLGLAQLSCFQWNEKANSNSIIEEPFLGLVMAFADLIRRERPSALWSSHISLAKNFCRRVPSAPSSMSINWIRLGGSTRQPAFAVLSLTGTRETPPPLDVITPLSFSQSFRASQPLYPFPGMSAPEPAEQNPDPSLRNKVSEQIASSLAKITDVEDNLFLLGDLLSRICKNLSKDSLLHWGFAQEATQDNAIILKVPRFFFLILPVPARNILMEKYK